MMVQRERALRTRPWVKLAIMALCAAVFCWEVALAGNQGELASYWLVPEQFLASVASHSPLEPRLYLPFLTATFLHADALHLVLNMVFLAAFADHVEDRLGHLRFAGFFLLGGALAAGVHVFTHPSSALPVVGASGAIAAVMGCFLVLRPLAHVRVVFVPLGAPAALLLVPWFALQLWSMSAPDPTGSAQTAWGAHSGGFAYGMGVALWLRLRPLLRRARRRRNSRARR
jgi:membrane associated rhomboid family serine protease